MPKAWEDEKILSYNDVVLRQSDLGILNGPHFLNDRIIEFYFSYLSSSHPSEDILLVPPAISFWILNCPDIHSLKDFLQPLNLPSRQLILFTVNDNDDVTKAQGGYHWSLLAFERNTSVFVHHDSNHGLNRTYSKRLYEIVVPYLGISDIGYMECPWCPQQVNAKDCGLYVLAFARVICCWFEKDGQKRGDLWFSSVKEQVIPSAVSRMRVEILELINSLRDKN